MTHRLTLFVFFFSFFACYLNAYSLSEPFATQILLRVDCGNGGEVMYELNGDPNLYTY